MSAHTDASFLRMFLIVLGALIAFTVIILFAAGTIGSSFEGARAEDPMRQTAVARRIAPVGKVNIAPEAAPAASATAAAPAAAPAVPAPPTAAAEPAPSPAESEAQAAVPAAEPAETAASAAALLDLAKGEEIYQSACMACHLTGAAGAPKLGDVAAWAPRIAQGPEVLLASVLNGKGAMPPKGGRLDLSDLEITKAVAYMVSQSQ